MATVKLSNGRSVTVRTVGSWVGPLGGIAKKPETPIGSIANELRVGVVLSSNDPALVLRKPAK